MATYLQAIHGFSPSLRRLLMAVALATSIFFGMQGVLQNLYVLRLGFDARFIGTMLAVGQLVWAAAALPASTLGRTIGLRNAIMLGYATSATGIALLLAGQSLPSQLWGGWFIGCQALVMLGVAFFSVNLAPYLMFITTDQNRRHAFGVFQATFPAAAFVGSIVAGLLPGFIAHRTGLSLDSADPYRYAMMIGPVIVLLALVPLAGAERHKLAKTVAQPGQADNAPVALLLLFGGIVFLAAIGESSARAFFNVYLSEGLGVPTAQIGTIMAFAQLLPIMAALSTPVLMMRLGTGYAYVTAILVLSVFLVGLAAFPFVSAAAVAYMGASAAITMIATARDLFGQELVTPRWRTVSASALIIGLALGWAVAGVVGGQLIDTVGFPTMYITGAVMTLVAASVLTTYLRLRRAPPPPELADGLSA